MADPLALRADAGALLPDLIALRRTLHAHPEAGFALPRTQRAVREALDGLGLAVTTGTEDFSSITAVVHGSRPGPAVLLRADMDALRVPERTRLPYSSRTDGIMHACGHDLHTAGLVGAARLLAARRDRMAGSVVLMFEPGEEAGGGALRMIREGVLDAAGPRVEAAYGVHVLPGAAGVFSTRGGTIMAGACALEIVVEGRGGHGSRPQQAVDPVPAVAQIVLALHAFATRRFPVSDPIVLSVTKLSGSEIINAIPDTSSLGATIRILSERSRRVLEAELPALAEGIAAAHGCRAEVSFRTVYPVTVNDERCAERALATIGALLGEGRALHATEPSMASEDFSAVLAQVPGAFLFVGATPEGIDPDEAEMNHSPRAVFDDGILADQAAALAALALGHVGADRG
ncbi:M20 family metallopeptidase [Microbacterium azadirachtae]|uniref:M20 metallopeptidase family protein n=1 Tax=Microbacterium azadirachtae TaxID=582680 RepID=UPI0021D49C35|nr:M20 family metallopeptidase [Microbacterium azadirachtae]UXW85402.1 M20 family metallopeptidase [Microbacterium azadirachtae]